MIDHIGALGPTRTIQLPATCPICREPLAYHQARWSSILTISHGAAVLIADAKALSVGPPYTRTPEFALYEFHGMPPREGR